ncbi:MAG: NAD-binding protein [Desulfurococcaceae archaeon]|uniref:TrkA family potassium uptake protein n=1 Tax=Staphylothermus marinus TaxID=2280 RepID=A0A7C4H8S0_STAMA
MKILIIGGGKSTEELLKNLDLRREEVTVVEKNPELRQEILSKFDVTVIGKDASDFSLYSEVKMPEQDVVIALTESDEVNVLSLSIAKMHEIPYRIALVSDRRIADLIRYLGIGIPVIQSSLVASVIMNYLFTMKNSIELMRFKIGEDEYHLYYVTVTENDQAIGQKITDIEKRAEPSLLKILMVFDGESFRAPMPDDEIKTGYQLIILSSLDNIDGIIKG